MFKKITNCEACKKNEDVSCDKFEDNYRLSNNKWIIDNCDNYDTMAIYVKNVKKDMHLKEMKKNLYIFINL